MSSNSKAAKWQSINSNEKQVEVGRRERRGTEEVEAEYEKEDTVSVTRQLCLKPIENCRNMDKEVALRRIRHRKLVNKARAAVGAILSLPFSTNKGEVQQKRWADDAFAAL